MSESKMVAMRRDIEEFELLQGVGQVALDEHNARTLLGGGSMDNVNTDTGVYTQPAKGNSDSQPTKQGLEPTSVATATPPASQLNVGGMASSSGAGCKALALQAFTLQPILDKVSAKLVCANTHALMRACSFDWWKRVCACNAQPNHDNQICAKACFCCRPCSRFPN